MASAWEGVTPTVALTVRDVPFLRGCLHVRFFVHFFVRFSA
jgi:hypothetical protein